jgi:hypothetical protein
MSDLPVVFTLTRVEAEHLRELVSQFASLVDGDRSRADPAIDRLTPDAYPDDPEASRDFRGLTRGELLGRRAHEAAVVGHDLERLEETRPEDALLRVDIPIARDDLGAWLRTLAAVRLVLAARLGIETDEDRDGEDPRFALYDWLGYRLDVLLQASGPD